MAVEQEQLAHAGAADGGADLVPDPAQRLGREGERAGKVDVLVALADGGGRQDENRQCPDRHQLQRAADDRLDRGRCRPRPAGAARAARSRRPAGPPPSLPGRAPRIRGWPDPATSRAAAAPWSPSGRRSQARFGHGMTGRVEQGEDGHGMDLRHHSPAGVRPPFGRYHHAGGGRRCRAGCCSCRGSWASGPTASIPEDAAAQAEQAFANIDACLAAAGFARGQVVRLYGVPDRSRLPAGLHAGPRRLGRRPAAGLDAARSSRRWRCRRARSRSKRWPRPERCGCSISTATRCRRAITAPCARWPWPGSPAPDMRSTCAISTPRASIRCSALPSGAATTILAGNRKGLESYVDRLQRAEALVVQFPTWCFGAPAMLKGFLDRLFLPGRRVRPQRPGPGQAAAAQHPRARRRSSPTGGRATPPGTWATRRASWSRATSAGSSLPRRAVGYPRALRISTPPPTRPAAAFLERGRPAHGAALMRVLVVLAHPVAESFAHAVHRQRGGRPRPVPATRSASSTSTGIGFDPVMSAEDRRGLPHARRQRGAGRRSSRPSALGRGAGLRLPDLVVQHARHAQGLDRPGLGAARHLRAAQGPGADQGPPAQHPPDRRLLDLWLALVVDPLRHRRPRPPHHLRGVRPLCHPRCRTFWLGHYRMDSSTPQSRERFLGGSRPWPPGSSSGDLPADEARPSAPAPVRLAW